MYDIKNDAFFNCTKRSIFVTDYGFLSFAKYMGKNLGRNTS